MLWVPSTVRRASLVTMTITQEGGEGGERQHDHYKSMCLDINFNIEPNKLQAAINSTDWFTQRERNIFSTTDGTSTREAFRVNQLNYFYRN